MSEDEKVMLGKHDTRIDNLEKKVDKLEGNNELLYRLAVVSEAQQIMNEKQSVQLEQMNETFKMVNQNLSNLNTSQEVLQKSVDKIGERVDTIEHDLEEEKGKDRISISELLKKWAKFILFGIPSAILLAYLLIEFNLK